MYCKKNTVSGGFSPGIVYQLITGTRVVLYAQFDIKLDKHPQQVSFMIIE